MRPYTLTLELARRESTADPFSFRLSEQEYLLRQEQGYLSAPLPWGSQLLQDLAELARPSPDRGAIQRLGDTLRTFLGRLDWERHEARLVEALQEGREVHLHLRFAAAELYVLPWELVTLKGSGQHLGELPNCQVHYEWPGIQAPAARATPPLEGGRLLFAWSAAGGAVPAEAHLRALREVCERNGYAFDPERDVLHRVSLRSLSEALSASLEPVAALHVLCHGSRSASQEYGLVWNASEGQGTAFVDAGDLRQCLAPYAASLRLVVLCACQGGGATPGSHLGSVAQALHRVGLPAVVASRLPLTAEGSVQLTETLYEELLGRLSPLHRALAAARTRLQQNAESLDWASLQIYARAGDEAASYPFVFRPYRGLLAFQPWHRRFFFGREALQQELLRRAEEALEGQRPRFQVVAGASGSGKTSLVMAGLVPLLSESSWSVAVMRPGEAGAEDQGAPAQLRTLAALQAQLRRHLPPGAPPSAPATSCEDILEEARRLRAALPERRLLLIVDQFEELFTQVPSPQERHAFVRALWELAREPALGTVVLATLRVDYFERCGELQVDEASTRLDTIVYSDSHRLFVPQLQPDQLSAVIEGPARRVGLELEPGLAERLRREVGQEPGALPLLAYTLDLLWQRREGHQLTHRACEELGGVTGALTRTADQLFDGLSPAEQHQARRLLVELVDFRDDSTPYTRRRAWLGQLRPASGESQEAFDTALDKLVSSRLLVRGGEGTAPGDAWLQVAHEALLRRWERLGEWVRADRERVLQLRELHAWAEDWAAHRGDADGGASYLLVGDRLGYARSLQEKYPEALSGASSELIERSRELTERRRRAARRRTGLTVGAALAVAVAMGGLAWKARRSELRTQDAARVIAADGLRTEDPTSSALLLLEVERPEGELAWVRSALQVLQQPLSRALFKGHAGALRSIALSADGMQVLTASDDGTARLWPAYGRGEPRVLAGHGGKLTTAAFNPEGTRVVTASEDGTARVWHTAGGHEPLVLQGHGGPVLAVGFSPDGTRVVTASMDGTVRVWQADGSGSPVVLQGHDGPVFDARFDPEGTRVVTASADHTARLWSADGKGEPLVLAGHTRQVRAASFSPSGRQVLTASWDGTARVWQADGSGSPVVLEGHSYVLSSASFSPEGLRVLTASWDGTARVWQADGSGKPVVLRGHSGPVEAAAFSPDGLRVLTASSDSTARVWQADGKGEPLILRGHDKAIVAATFVASGAQVLTASLDGTGRRWEVAGAGEPRALPGTAPAFSPDGKRVATLGKDGVIRVWALESQGEPLELHGRGGPGVHLTFSPDGQLLLSVTEDGAVRLWPAEGKGEPRVLGAPGVRLTYAAFSPDGKRVVATAEDGAARVWQAEGPGEPVLLRGHEGALHHAAFSPDGARVATASEDGTARLWPVDDKGEPLVLRGHTGAVLDVGFSPDGLRVATASKDGMARLWRVDGKGEPLVLRGHTASVTELNFSPDGTRLVTASADGTARLWRVDGKAEVTVLTGHVGAVLRARFSPDGKWVSTASLDGTARIWPADGGGAPIVLRDDGFAMTIAAVFSPEGARVATASLSDAHVWSLGAEALGVLLREVTTVCLTEAQRQQLLRESTSTARERYEACERSHLRVPRAAVPPVLPVSPTAQEPAVEKPQESMPAPWLPRGVTLSSTWGLGAGLGTLAMLHVTGSKDAAKLETMLGTLAVMLGIELGDLSARLSGQPEARERAATWLLHEVSPGISRQLSERYGSEHSALLNLALRSSALLLAYEPGRAKQPLVRTLCEEIRHLQPQAKLPARLWEPLLGKVEAGEPREQVKEAFSKLMDAVEAHLQADMQ